jgi:hypothetical protein
MIIYNVTVVIDDDISEEWLNWMTKKHIPNVMATGKFIDGKLSRILAEEEGGKSYSIQYLCKDRETYEAYLNENVLELQREHNERYKDKFVAFRTILNVLHHFENNG